MKDYKEKSLIDVLSFCDLRDLPEEDKKEYVWVRAIGLVEKNNGTQNYAVLTRNIKIHAKHQPGTLRGRFQHGS
jgi:hypothetical protein